MSQTVCPHFHCVDSYMSLFSAFAVLFLTSPALSQSISIPIPNYDFASPYVPDLSPFAEAGVSNWVQSPPPAWWTADGYSTLQWDDNVGVFVNVPSEWIDNLVPSGGTAVHQQAAFMFSAPGLELSQTLSTAYQVGASYQLTVGIEGGGEGMPLGVPMQIELYYLDGSGNQVPVGTTTVLNDLTLNPYMGQYITDLPDRQLTIPAVAAGDPWAGQNIGVALLQIAGTANTGYWDIDNVRLTATTVPEPGSIALLVAGFGMLVLRKRSSLGKQSGQRKPKDTAQSTVKDKPVRAAREEPDEPRSRASLRLSRACSPGKRRLEKGKLEKGK